MAVGLVKRSTSWSYFDPRNQDVVSDLNCGIRNAIIHKGDTTSYVHHFGIDIPKNKPEERYAVQYRYNIMQCIYLI